MISCERLPTCKRMEGLFDHIMCFKQPSGNVKCNTVATAVALNP